MTHPRLAKVQVALMLLTRPPAVQLQAPVPLLGQSAWAFPLNGMAVGGLGALTLMAALPCTCHTASPQV